MQFAFRGNAAPESGELTEIPVTARFSRDISGTLPTRPPRVTCPDLPNSNGARLSPTAGVGTNSSTVVHRNGTSPAGGTQSQGLRKRNTPGCRIGPPEVFWSRPDPVRKEVCYAETRPSRTQSAVESHKANQGILAQNQLPALGPAGGHDREPVEKRTERGAQ